MLVAAEDRWMKRRTQIGEKKGIRGFPLPFFIDAKEKGRKKVSFERDDVFEDGNMQFKQR